MKEFMRRVEEFHGLIGAPVGVPFPTAPDDRLIDIGGQLIDLAKTFEMERDDAYRRLHLTLEEMGEWLVALGQANELLALDALADRLFVLIGDAVCYDFPLEEALREVCRSNLTKRPQADDPARHRVRKKGAGYQPPDIVGVLDKHRAKYANEILEGEVSDAIPNDLADHARRTGHTPLNFGECAVCHRKAPLLDGECPDCRH